MQVLLLLLLLGFSGARDAQDTWRSDCSLLGNRRLAPFVYFSQAEVAVVAHYSGIDFNTFDSGRRIEFDITPVCFAKGYVTKISMRVVSGYQKCPLTPMPQYLQYPALFFLRRFNGSDQLWEMLNGGDYPHRAGTSGLLFGNGESGDAFLRTCGLQRTRIAMDATGCTVSDCRSYCTYNLPPRHKCVTARAEVERNSPGTQLPPDVPPYDVSTRGGTAAVRPEASLLLTAVLVLAKGL